MTVVSEFFGGKFVLAVCVFLLAITLFVSDGLFTVDELIYLLGADAFAKNGGLIVENGFDSYHSENLRLWFLIDGPNGLAPQYPPGVAVVGGVFLKVLGVKGLIFTNVLAGIGTIIATHRLALELYHDRAIAKVSTLILIFGTFFTEYVFGIWPHMISTFFVISSLLFLMKAINSKNEFFKLTVTSGALIGMGFLFRSDTILILPTVAAIVIMYAARPVLMLAYGALGMLPWFVMASIANLHKFGTLNPLSYGNASGGGDDPSTHLSAIIGISVFLAVLIGVRNLNWSASFRLPTITAVVLLLLAAWIIPSTHEIVSTFVHGFNSLFIDMRQISDVRDGIVRLDGNVVSFWGVGKKALGQSLPWLGVLAVLLCRPWGIQNRRGHLLILIAVVIWSAPFVAKDWHGGFSSNMRYFLPVVPLVCILGANLLVSLRASEKVNSKMYLATALFAILLVVVWSVSFSTRLVGAQQILGVFALYGMVFVSLVCCVSVWDRSACDTAIKIAMSFCFGLSFMYGPVIDLLNSQNLRNRSAVTSQILAEIEEPALFYEKWGGYAVRLTNPTSLVAMHNWAGGPIDENLVRDALADGRRVFMPVLPAEEMKLALGNITLREVSEMFTLIEMVEIVSINN